MFHLEAQFILHLICKDYIMFFSRSMKFYTAARDTISVFFCALLSFFILFSLVSFTVCLDFCQLDTLERLGYLFSQKANCYFCEW